MIHWIKLNAWANTILYQVTNGKLTVNVEVETIKDKTGGLKRVCSSFGDFEVRTMSEVKLCINAQFKRVEDEEKAKKEEEANFVSSGAFDDYLETHFEIAAAIGVELAKEKPCEVLEEIQSTGGQGAIWEYCKEKTDIFQARHKGREWDGEFYDVIEEYIENEVLK